jgi:hypothetical protein
MGRVAAGVSFALAALSALFVWAGYVPAMTVVTLPAPIGAVTAVMLVWLAALGFAIGGLIALAR